MSSFQIQDLILIIRVRMMREEDPEVDVRVHLPVLLAPILRRG